MNKSIESLTDKVVSFWHKHVLDGPVGAVIGVLHALWFIILGVPKDFE